MSRMGDYVIGLEEDATLMSRDEFIRTNGAQNVDVWDRVNDDYQYQPDPEDCDDGC